MSTMDFFTAMEVSASGLSAERTRMNVAASNLANAQTTQAAGGGPYKRKDVTLQSVDVPGVQGTPFAQAVKGVAVSQISQDTAPPRLEYDPGHPQAFQALEIGGASLVPLPVDTEGIRVSAGIAAAPKARLAVVTPTHQSPLGVSLSLPRRLALLAWAEEARAWVLEDDYDAEFRYTGPAPPALKSLDRGERVLFAGSFSKTLFPGLRLGYLVVPEPLIETMTRAARLITRGPALLEQNVTAAFLAGGHFARHVKRMRGLYARRRAALARALSDHFPVELAAGGMHLLIRLPDGVDDSDVARRALTAGLAPTALASLSIAHASGRGLLLGFTNAKEEEAATLVARLVAAARG